MPLATFAIAQNRIKVIESPADFYSAIIQGVKDAEQRIVLASLYIAHPPLLAAIRDRLHSNPHVKLYILVDYLRSTRDNNQIDRYSRLATAFPGRIRVALFHTPNATFLLKLAPKRFNEGVGLQHSKIYLFDHHVIISGANLSLDYFTNRQDRYVSFLSAGMADYMHQLVSVISDFSFRLENATLMPPRGFDNREGGANYRKLFKLALEDLFKSASDESVQAILKFERDQVLTTVSIAVELAALGIHQDSTATTALLSNENEDCRITIAAGYLNLPTTYQSLILNSKNKIDILTGSPEANGFFNSQGVSRHIPAAYSYLQLLFQTDVRQAGREMCIKVYEYFRKGWTWHAKGLWIVPNNPRNPYTTAIGSSNFNYRSLERDLETQLFIRTKCPTLISQFEAVY